ncbi:hypothetical protein RND71_042587 [Anisodus tanguticus]|uniref:Uncharacterized protein n=1 Tax=Anisodus tanguticus TaxID=243964 RepID=A0AAE1QR80_9SOLA|nr:hypothetical protein RND71_042587 [Anisodus tanguticus]
MPLHKDDIYKSRNSPKFLERTKKLKAHLVKIRIIGHKLENAIFINIIKELQIGK